MSIGNRAMITHRRWPIADTDYSPNPNHHDIQETVEYTLGIKPSIRVKHSLPVLNLILPNEVLFKTAIVDELMSSGGLT